MLRAFCIVLALSSTSACDSGRAPMHADAFAGDASRDAARADGGDAASIDGATIGDVGAREDGGAPPDASALDADVFRDAYVGVDAATFDVGLDAFAAVDAFMPRDAGVDAPATGGCVSGASGTHVVRFRWAGSGPGSTAYVVYEANTLPDTSRWHVSAASMSIGYTPRFDDTFLGEGGLDLSGTVFIDVELTTAGLSSIRDVSIGVYGRSFATTTSGSFTWQTFTDVGGTPSNSVANSAPYEWYLGDATTAFAPGDTGVYLRLRAGPSSDALIVNRVEICFTAS